MVILMHPTSLVFCFFLFFFSPSSFPCFLSSGGLLTAAAISGRLHPHRRPLLCCPVLTHLLYIKVAARSHLNPECSCQVQQKKRKEKKKGKEKKQSALSLPLVSFQKRSCKYKERRRQSLARCNIFCPSLSLIIPPV